MEAPHLATITKNSSYYQFVELVLKQKIHVTFWIGLKCYAVGKWLYWSNQRELPGFSPRFHWMKIRFPNMINCEARLFPRLHSTIYAHKGGFPFWKLLFEIFWCSNIFSISGNIQITYQSGIVGLRGYLKKSQQHHILQDPSGFTLTTDGCLNPLHDFSLYHI